MGLRDKSISDAIYRAVFDNVQRSPRRLLRVLGFFSLFSLALAKYKSEVFKQLRDDVWRLDDAEYRESFSRKDQSGKKSRMNPIGDLGYSGSTFFATANNKFLVKSLPRRSEWAFFQDDLLQPYFEHMSRNPSSVLVRIADFLYAPYLTLGYLLGVAPSHHIVMENVMYGKHEDVDHQDAWETYDLKPSSYFYPERDIAGGALAPESVKDRLIDEFKDKIRCSSRDRDALVETLVHDTKLLESANAIDYSLFLVRYPAPVGANDRQIARLQSPTAGPWRQGVRSADDKWEYRAVVLDFFWAKHTVQAKAMTGLINGYNLIDKKGPMSITTDPKEYRTRFLKMVEELFEVPPGA